MKAVFLQTDVAISGALGYYVGVPGGGGSHGRVRIQTDLNNCQRNGLLGFEINGG